MRVILEGGTAIRLNVGLDDSTQVMLAEFTENSNQWHIIEAMVTKTSHGDIGEDLEALAQKLFDLGRRFEQEQIKKEWSNQTYREFGNGQIPGHVAAALPPPPNGYGIVIWHNDYKGRGAMMHFVAVPHGRYCTRNNWQSDDEGDRAYFEVGNDSEVELMTDGDRGPFWQPPEDVFIFDEELNTWCRPSGDRVWYL